MAGRTSNSDKFAARAAWLTGLSPENREAYRALSPVDREKMYQDATGGSPEGKGTCRWAPQIQVLVALMPDGTFRRVEIMAPVREGGKTEDLPKDERAAYLAAKAVAEAERLSFALDAATDGGAAFLLGESLAG